MNSFEQDFKEQLQTELKEQPQSVFTKNERARVLHNIHKEKQKIHILPKLLTAIAAVVGMFLIASVFSEEEQPSTSSTAEIEKEPLPSYWLMDQDVGINYNGWTMVSKTEKEPQIVFSGYEVITGHSYKENNQWFLKVDNYQYNLPLEPRRDNGIILTFPQGTDSDPEFTSNANTLDTITVKEIVVTYEAEGAPNYTVTEFDFGDTLELSIYEKDNLPEQLHSVYAMLKSGEINQGIMKELTPMDIFHLFVYADGQTDYEVQYALFNHENKDMGFDSYEEYEKESRKYQHIDSFQAFENQQLKQVIVDESSAYITPVDQESPISFGLNKSAEGIWKANWLPLQ